MKGNPLVQLKEGLTPAQARAQIRLGIRIRRALDGGHSVPCVGHYDRFDHEAGDPAQACAGCPVISACRAYADTGAVTYGIIAGRLASSAPTRQAAA